MRLEHFHYLLEIGRLRSISAAARALNIGQMRLSTIVRQAELEVGFPIFKRTSKGVKLTVAGEQFMALAWEINIKYEILMSLKKREAESDPLITLLISPSIALRAAIPLTEAFYSFSLPGRLKFEERPSRTTRELLLQRYSNIGIAYLNEYDMRYLERQEDSTGLQVEPLLEDRFCLLIGKDHPLAGRDYVTAQDIRGEHLARPRRLDSGIMPETLQINCKYVTGFSGFDTMCQAIAELGMVGLVPEFLRADDCALDPARFRFIPLRGEGHANRIHACLLTCKGRRLLHQEQLLILCIQEYFKQARAQLQGDENDEN